MSNIPILPAPTDRGLLYGDGVFRTLAWRAGEPVAWAEQHAKLAADGARLGIAAPGAEALRAALQAACGDRASAAIRITLTRGSAPRGYLPPADPAPCCYVGVGDLPDYPLAWADGLVVRWCRLRLARQPALAGIKHLNRLEQVLARSEWRDPAIAEGLCRDTAGWVIGGVQSNLLLRRGERVLTPRLDQVGIAGVSRDRACRALAAAGWRVREARLRPADLLAADELVLTNALWGVWPVAELQADEGLPGRHYTERRLYAALRPTLAPWRAA